MDEGDALDPIITGAVLKAGQFADKAGDSVAKEAGGILVRLFGPSADVMGTHWANQLREKNLNRLLRKTEKRAKKVEDTGEDPGFANPRVASQVFESAQYADQEVVAEYLSGVLASSRDASGKDDAGVAWSNVVARLSSDQLRLHFAIYASIRPVILSDPPDRTSALHGLEIVMPTNPLADACGFSSIERYDDAVDGLLREGLIDDGYRYGNRVYVWTEVGPTQEISFPHDHATTFHLSIHGIRLFLWGTGAGRLPTTSYVDPAVVLNPVDQNDLPQPIQDVNFKNFYLVDKATEASPAQAETP
ncbi:hypothetical protein [Microbacterium sp. RURRCA19A]|uniref:Abi-alpha family protein n=1 Tax=Microbacterium sp. RURRCA19A TaxID=1907391 RepID=UPI000954D28D|nr:hypothetical protein [Microbacterium sp. RURRCA19A]SIS07737.1 hypothetical protein SAMN05880568_2582 [Microbacterium sp. RURRCA19A]